MRIQIIDNAMLVEILSELENITDKFPRLALEKAIEQRVAITPVLLGILEQYKNNQQELLENPDYTLHIYALYLLAQFREPLAYPLIVEFFSIPGDISLDITGDLVTEDLDRILASVSGGNIDLIKQVIENQQANEYVRSAAVKSLLVLVAQGLISRQEIIQYFEELFSSDNKNKSDSIWTKLVINSSRLCAKELKPHIERLFEEQIIDPLFISMKNVDDDFQRNPEATLTQLRENPRYSLIDDTISEIESWTCFRQENRNYPNSISFPQQEFTQSFNKAKTQAYNKKKRQKESRQKNRHKKK